MIDAKVLQRAARLKALASSSNEHEAANALAALQKLSDKHEFAIASLSEMGCDSDVVCDDHPVFCTRCHTPAWKLDLLLVLAEFNGCCEYHKVEPRGLRRYMLAGKAEDVERVRFLWAQTVAVLSRLTPGRGSRASREAWLLGAVAGIESQLRQARRQKSKPTTQALAVVDKRRMLACEQIERLCGGKPAVEPTSTDRLSYQRYKDGRDTGKRLSLGLTRPLSTRKESP